jgi:hypothetical protein
VLKPLAESYSTFGAKISRRDPLFKCPNSRPGIYLWEDAERIYPEGLVPEGQSDRSLARSAWESVIQESRPVGYGLIRIRTGERPDSSDWRIGVRNSPYET